MGRLHGPETATAFYLPDGTTDVTFVARQAQLFQTEGARLRSEGKDSHALLVTEAYWALMAETDPRRLREAVKALSDVLFTWESDLDRRIGDEGSVDGYAADPRLDLIRTGTERSTRAHLAERRKLVTHDGICGHVGDSLCGITVGDQVYLDDRHGWEAPSLNGLELCSRCCASRDKRRR
jgi:hypothetical protein